MSQVSEDILPINVARYSKVNTNVPGKRASLKFFILGGFLFVCGAILCVIGGISWLRHHCKVDRRNSCRDNDTSEECEKNPWLNYDPETLCEYSRETRRIMLPEFLTEVKKVYYELRPETVAWDPAFDDYQLVEHTKKR